MKEMKVSLTVMLSDRDYALLEKSVSTSKRTINDELKRLSRKGISDALNKMYEEDGR